MHEIEAHLRACAHLSSVQVLLLLLLPLLMLLMMVMMHTLRFSGLAALHMQLKHSSGLVLI